MDLNGEWSPRVYNDGVDIGDYTGIPLNDAGRLRAESWNASRLELPEEQCRVHISPYIYRGPTNIAVWEERDPNTRELIAIIRDIRK